MEIGKEVIKKQFNLNTENGNNQNNNNSKGGGGQGGQNFPFLCCPLTQ